MDIGIGLPNHIAHVHGSSITRWAVAAEKRGFASLTTIDCLPYPGLDSLLALTSAAGATSGIGLITNVLLAPLYPAALLAKQLASLSDISGGRLILGVGVGSRPDDYDALGVDFHRRGQILDHTVEVLRRGWHDGLNCPTPVDIPLLFGGSSPATLRRVITVGDGWAGGALRNFPAQSDFADRVRAGWQERGRNGTPRFHASVNFALGDDEAVCAGQTHLRNYYGFKPDYAELNVADLITSSQDAAATVRAYRDLGFDALLFHPCVDDPDQIDRLADAVL
jgi:alkanesulfonate monooxygenase SsuD/methylene tetrahydromethanopterin reductase-like flavin-dependent oxidoreductase (luciferase family)